MKKIILLMISILSITVFGERIRVGFIENEFTQTRIEGKTFNDHMVELIKNELNSEVEKISGGWNEIHELFLSDEIDMIIPVERTQSPGDQSIFSENLYSQNFYVASQGFEIREITQLQNKKIYTKKESFYKEILEGILGNADIKAEIIEVEDIYSYGDEIVALPETLIQGFSSKFKVGALPSSAIRAKKNQEENITKINSALRTKYRTKIIEHRKFAEKEMRYKFFLNSLTSEEREYLKNLKEINVSYEEFSPVSTYIKDDGIYTGLTPIMLEKLSENLGVKIKIVNSPLDSWEKIFNIFQNEKSDLLAMAKTENREKKFLFSKKIMDLRIYRISTKQYTSSDGIEKIGVIKNSIEEDLAYKYYHPEEIVSFINLETMGKNLKNGNLSAILTFDNKMVEGIDYNSEVFHYVPMNIAFSKKNIHLKNIFDKSLLYLIDKDRVIEEFAIREREILQSKADMVSSYSLWLKILALLLCVGAYKVHHSKKMVELAFIDSLSKLGNRYSFDKLCESIKGDSGIAIVIDLDNFKNANDTYGHAVGDQIITYCAQIFKKILGQEKVFRISGDEYYAFIPLENHENILEKLKKEIDDRVFLKSHQISCSIGYCIKTTEDEVAQCFKHADMAMYQAKSLKGTGCFKATEEFIAKSLKDTFIRENLERCLEHEFYPVFQPKVDVDNSKKIIGAEALARWGSSKMGVISPMDFIPIAESMGVINKIDLKIAEASIKQLREWMDEKLIGEDFVLSCNVSMQTFENENIGLVFGNLLKKYGVSGKNLEVEITESIISKNMTVTLEKLNSLKSMGISLSLDDFTAGHSTAGILPMLPIDIVKFDRSLILSMGYEKEKGSKVYISLINLIKDMGLSITAEGVEKSEEHDFLKKNGVEYAQGFFFGRPLKESEFRENFLYLDSEPVSEEIEEVELELSVI